MRWARLSERRFSGAASGFRRSLALLAVVGAALPGLAATAREAAPTVILLVRHAERAPGSGDVPLSDTGQARAMALAAIGAEAGVNVIITTQFQRTRQTAAPLAARLGITPDVVAAQGNVAMHAEAVSAAVKRQAGMVVLVVGHSNTIPAIVSALGGKRYPDLCEAEYDRLFTVVLEADGTARTIRSRFGAPTPVGSDCAPMRQP